VSDAQHQSKGPITVQPDNIKRLSEKCRPNVKLMIPPPGQLCGYLASAS